MISLNKYSPRIAREGHIFIAIFFIITLAASWLWWPLFFVGLPLTLWCVYFFRDPVRFCPQNPQLIISPADGVIVNIKQTIPGKDFDNHLGEDEMILISIFMDVFNCHVNRSPIAGIIDYINYIPGKFINAELDKASEDNERTAIIINDGNHMIGVVQIAGLVARRIVSWIKPDQRLMAGEKIGLIRFGSRVDVLLPAKINLRVGMGQTVIAGETILADLATGQNDLKIKAI